MALIPNKFCLNERSLGSTEFRETVLHARPHILGIEPVVYGCCFVVSAYPDSSIGGDSYRQNTIAIRSYVASSENGF